MVEVLQWLFVTERDQLIYSNKKKLCKEMIEEYDFDESEVTQAMNWFEPIGFEYQNLLINTNATREFSDWEKRFVPQSVIDKVLHLESKKSISSLEREILFDRLGELCLDCEIEIEEMDVIFNGLLSHMKNYSGVMPFSIEQKTNVVYYWMNSTVH
mgnify:CR=1 FL=1|jgi:uncharacterized protein Smg (DUF494 family)